MIMRPILVLIVTGIVLEATSSDAFVPEWFRMKDGPYQMEEESDGSKEACCHSDSLKGTLHIYSSSLKAPQITQFYHDLANRRLAMVYGNKTDPMQPDRTVVKCMNNNVCIVTHIMERRMVCQQRMFPMTTLDDFWPRCIPQGSTRLPIQAIGVASAMQSLKVKMFEYPRAGVKVRTVVSEAGCFPVVDLVDINGRTPNGYFSIFFFDLETRITTKSVFDIPSYCPLPKTSQILEEEIPDHSREESESPVHRNSLMYLHGLK